MNSIITGGMLAASLLLGQTGEPPAGAKRTTVPPPPFIQQAQAQQQPSRPIFGWFSRDDRPLVTKIQSWWKRDTKEMPPNAIPAKDVPLIRDTPATPVSKPKPAPIPSNDFPRKLPNPQSKATTPAPVLTKDASPVKNEVQQTTLNQSAPAKAAKYPILPQWIDKIGRDEKFEWITGQLEMENGNFVLYYATPETIDKHNGRIILTPQQVEMNQFKKGDLVSVRGQLVQRQSLQGNTPTYRLTHASLIERPKS